MKNNQVITIGKQSRRDYSSVERNTSTQSGMPSGMPPVINGCIPDGMPGKAGAMRFYRAIFPTGMGQSANNLLQVIYFTLLIIEKFASGYKMNRRDAYQYLKRCE